MPKSVETSQGSNVTLLWNQQVQTDRTVPNNKPDIIIRDNEKGTLYVFFWVFPWQSDAGEIPKRIHTIFKTWRKSEIKKREHVC